MKEPADEQKVVLITGGARRIGAEIAQSVHSCGANVIIHYNTSAADASVLCEQLNNKRTNSAVAIKMDLSDVSQFPSFIDEACHYWGRLDVLINNASTFFPTPMETVSESDWHLLIDINLRAPFFLANCARSELARNQGLILNLADHHLTRPFRHYSVYNIAKSAHVMLTKSLAKEFAPEIRVNCIAPGLILWAENDKTDEQREQLLQENLLSDPGCPQDIAKSVLFFIKDAGFITGQILTIDGGRSLNW